MKGDAVGNGDVIADAQRITVGVVGAGMGDMQYRVVLNTATFANADAMHIASHGGIRPYRTVPANMHIANDDGTGVNKYTLAKLGCLSIKATNIVVGAIRHGVAPVVKHLLHCNQPNPRRKSA